MILGPSAVCGGGYVEGVGAIVAMDDFWIPRVVNGRDWALEKKLRAIGISPGLVLNIQRKRRTAAEAKAFNRLKKQKRARTGRKR